MSKNPEARASSNLAVVLIAGLLTWLVSSLIFGFIMGSQNLPEYWPLAQRGLATH